MELISFTQRGFLVKHETTEGVDALPVPGTDGFRLFEGQCQVTAAVSEMPEDKAYLGHDDFAVGQFTADISGQFRLVPPPTPGAAATSDASAALILLPAGMAVTKDLPNKITRYNPISTGIPSRTLAWYQAKNIRKVLGARGDISDVAMEIGQIFRGSVTIGGEMLPPTKAVMPSITLPTERPRVSSKRNSELILNTLGVGATASTAAAPLVDFHGHAKRLALSFGNQRTNAEYTELGVQRINNRQPTWSLRLAAKDLDTEFDPYWLWQQGVVLEADYFLYEDDTKDGLYSVLGIRGKIDNVTDQDIDGDAGWEITGRCLPTPGVGNDEFYIGFGDAAP